MLTCPKGEVVHALYEAAVESSRVTGLDSTAQNLVSSRKIDKFLDLIKKLECEAADFYLVSISRKYSLKLSYFHEST